MKEVKIFSALFLCLCVALPVSFAAEVFEKANSEKYGEKVAPMFGRGLVNVATSPVDILVQTVDKSKEGPALLGTLSGMATGLGCTGIRAGSGLVDVALFWVPGFNGFPVSESYHDCLTTEEEKPVQVVQPSVAAPVYVEPTPAPSPIVTVTEEAPAAAPKRKVRDPYRYVKK